MSSPAIAGEDTTMRQTTGHRSVMSYYSIHSIWSDKNVKYYASVSSEQQTLSLLLLNLRLCESTCSYCMDIRMYRLMLTNVCYILPSYICKPMCLSACWALSNTFGKQLLASSFLVPPSIRMKKTRLSQKVYSWNFFAGGALLKVFAKIKVLLKQEECNAPCARRTVY